MNYLTMDFGGTLAKYSVMDENCQVLLREEAPAPKASADQYYDFSATNYKERYMSGSVCRKAYQCLKQY